MDEDDSYDVVLATLREKREKLWKMTQQNLNADAFNIMDQIRFDQIDELDKAMEFFRKHKESEHDTSER